jgi:hypothetical protein
LEKGCDCSLPNTRRQKTERPGQQREDQELLFGRLRQQGSKTLPVARRVMSLIIFNGSNARPTTSHRHACESRRGSKSTQPRSVDRSQSARPFIRGTHSLPELRDLQAHRRAVDLNAQYHDKRLTGLTAQRLSRRRVPPRTRPSDGFTSRSPGKNAVDAQLWLRDVSATTGPRTRTFPWTSRADDPSLTTSTRRNSCQKGNCNPCVRRRCRTA